jgi:hypothetical protein
LKIQKVAGKTSESARIRQEFTEKTRKTMEKHPDFFVFDALFTLLPDGRLLNKVKRSNKTQVGQEAGFVRLQGYRGLRFMQKDYLTHRVVWLLATGHWPKHGVDHIDGNKLNNRIENLRDVDNQTNSQNRRGAQSNSGTGFRGVYRSRARFIARGQCPVTRGVVHLGTFDSAPVAAAAFNAYAEANYLGYVKHKETV